METTSLYWRYLTFAFIFGVAAAVWSQPLLFTASAGIVAFVFVLRVRFLAAVAETLDSMSVTQTLSRDTVQSGEPNVVTVRVSLERPVPSSLTISPTLPSDVDVTQTANSELTLSPGEQSSEVSFEVQCSNVGTHVLGSPRCCFEDTVGLYSVDVSVGHPIKWRVSPDESDESELGRSTQSLPLGPHPNPNGSNDQGHVAELREYSTGDAANRIDWKATARLNQPYVKTYDSMTEALQYIVVDTRPTMRVGRASGSKLDYALNGALIQVTIAEERSTLLGLLIFSESGIDTLREPDSGTQHYELLRTDLQSRKPDRDSERLDSAPRRKRRLSPRETRTDVLSADRTDFGAKLSPFFEADHLQSERANNDLRSVIQTVLSMSSGNVHLAVFTDDSDWNQLDSISRLAGGDGNRVDLFLTPDGSFHRTGELNAEEGFDRYAEQLSALPRVSVFELSPTHRQR